jgi:hypothetical protein
MYIYALETGSACCFMVYDGMYLQLGFVIIAFNHKLSSTNTLSTKVIIKVGRL